MDTVTRRERAGERPELAEPGRERPVIVPDGDGMATVLLPGDSGNGSGEILEVTGQEAEAIFAMSEKTLRKYGRLARARIEKRSGRVYYDAIRLDAFVRTNLEPVSDGRDLYERLRELRQRSMQESAGNDRKGGQPAVEVAEEFQDGPVTAGNAVAAISVPEQAAMASIVISQRDDLRAKIVEIESVKKAVWSVSGILVTALIGTGCLGWLLADKTGKLGTAEAVAVERAERIVGLGLQVGGLAGQLEVAGRREGQKQAEIDELKKMVLEGRLTEDQLTARIVELQAGWLETEQEAGKLRLEIEKIRQDYRIDRDGQ